MAELVFWQNGDTGKKVKEAIEASFNNINNQLNLLSITAFDFKISDWKDGKITIDYSVYSKQNPCVDLYIKSSNKYSLVYGGYEILSNSIELLSDMPYEGRVVIR